MSLDWWRKVEYMVKTWNTRCYLLSDNNAIHIFCSPVKSEELSFWCIKYGCRLTVCTNKPLFQRQIPQNSALLQVSDEKIQRCFIVWRCDDANLTVSQSLIRQLFTEITVKRSTNLSTLWTYLLTSESGSSPVSLFPLCPPKWMTDVNLAHASRVICSLWIHSRNLESSHITLGAEPADKHFRT